MLTSGSTSSRRVFLLLAVPLIIFAAAQRLDAQLQAEGFVNDNIDASPWMLIADVTSPTLPDPGGFPPTANDAKASIWVLSYASYHGDGWARDDNWGAEQSDTSAKGVWRRQDYQYIGPYVAGDHYITAQTYAEALVTVTSRDASASAGGFAEVTAATENGNTVPGVESHITNVAKRTTANTVSLGGQYKKVGVGIGFTWFTGTGTE